MQIILFAYHKDLVEFIWNSVVFKFSLNFHLVTFVKESGDWCFRFLFLFDLHLTGAAESNIEI